MVFTDAYLGSLIGTYTLQPKAYRACDLSALGYTAPEHVLLHVRWSLPAWGKCELRILGAGRLGGESLLHAAGFVQALAASGARLIGQEVLYELATHQIERANDIDMHCQVLGNLGGGTPAAGHHALSLACHQHP